MVITSSYKFYLNKKTNHAFTRIIYLFILYSHEERFPPFDDTGQRAYENACTKFKALPIKAFHRQLADSTEIDMRYYGAGPTGAKAIAIPMVVSCIGSHRKTEQFNYHSFIWSFC